MQNQNLILKKINDTVPETTGVYFWKNANNEIIYVGKAKNLKKRMKQYFEGHINSWLTPAMLDSIKDFEFKVCSSEKDAFLSELKFIKDFNPRYNIKLRYKRSYPYFIFRLNKGSLNIEISDDLTKKNIIYYFGPLTPNTDFSSFYDVLVNSFLYHNGQKIENKELTYWYEQLDIIKSIFKNKYPKFREEIFKKEMQFNSKLEFELAAKYKNALSFLDSLWQNQITEIKNTDTIDIFSFQKLNDKVFVALRSYQHGSLVLFDSFIRNWSGLINEFIENFITNFVANKKEKKSKINLDFKYKDENLIFDENINKRIVYPQKGIFKLIIDNLNENNQAQVDKYIKTHNNKNTKVVWTSLQADLNLDNIDKFIMFDNSFENNRDEIVGFVLARDQNGTIPSFYVTNNLSKLKKEYDIKSDVHFTYYNALIFIQKNLHKITNNDIFIADGGLAHINEIKQALYDMKLNNKVFGLIKDDKHKTKTLINDQNKKINISDQSFLFFADMQDKVDKYAKKHYRSLSNRKISIKQTLNIPGVGEKSIKVLIKHFKSFENIKNATQYQLSEIVNKTIASQIFEHFNKKK
ncbi:excinuclease ABC subunit C [Mycoplasmopsis mustelae]|uniref:Excinuclease cho n=1 Tax=Mycoplasmopsis mustelae TaxID=171289 RepID=A0A4R7UD16_9BACT|nr:GIY-YIG nuclease family protein [Mycoplasmopsis mustelae]TDV24347.1 excinuclease ABC subunit C [Mycoplasmopsis mustelae]